MNPYRDKQGRYSSRPERAMIPLLDWMGVKTLEVIENNLAKMETLLNDTRLLLLKLRYSVQQEKGKTLN